MRVRIDTLDGYALDWAVAKAQRVDVRVERLAVDGPGVGGLSTKAADGGYRDYAPRRDEAIMEAIRSSFDSMLITSPMDAPRSERVVFEGSIRDERGSIRKAAGFGPNVEVATLRAYVKLMLGEEELDLHEALGSAKEGVA